MTDATVQLSVIVTVVDGGAVLEETLASLLHQEGDVDLEVLLPYDPSIAAEVKPQADRDPRLRLLPMDEVATERPLRSAAGQHELFDRRRARGLAAARGRLIGIVEDRGVPALDWARSSVAAHEGSDAAAIGGPVACGAETLLAKAVYFCDFSRYQPPIEPGQASWVTDVNIVYKREPLMAVKELWIDRYHETTVHWELQRRSATLELQDRALVHQRRGRLRLGQTLSERFQWGRLFAHTRARELPRWRLPLYALGCLVLPVLLFARHGLLQWRKRQLFGDFLVASPLVLLLLIFWSFGEAAAYLGARP